MKHRAKYLLAATTLVCSIVFAANSSVSDQTRRSSAVPPIDLELNIPDGNWHFAESAWNLSQSEPRQLDSLPMPHISDWLTVADSDSDSTELDKHLLHLVRASLAQESRSGDLRRYRTETEGLRGVAVTCMINDVERPLAIAIAWPAFDGMWSVFEAQKNIDGNAAPIVQLPDGCEILATRTSEGGKPFCHLVNSSYSSQQLKQQFEEAGYLIDQPMAGQGIDSIFRIRTSGEEFEITLNSDETNTESTFLVRRISALKSRKGQSK